MMKRVNQLQARLAEAQQKLDEARVEASSGGGAVTVVMTAKPTLESITIQPEAMDIEDIQMLQDMITAATNEALQKVRDTQEKLMGNLTGGLNIPGLPSM